MTRPIPSLRELGRRPGRDEAPTGPVPVHPGSDGHDVVPIAGILPAGHGNYYEKDAAQLPPGTLARRPVASPARPVGRRRRPPDRLGRAGRPPRPHPVRHPRRVHRPGGSRVRVRLDGAQNDFVIRIRHPGGVASGGEALARPVRLVVTFQTATKVPTAGPRPLLELPSTLPLPRTGTLPVLKLQAVDALPPVHRHLQAAEPVGSDAQDRRAGQLVPVTPIELSWRDSPHEHPGPALPLPQVPFDPTAQRRSSAEDQPDRDHGRMAPGEPEATTSRPGTTC